MGVFDSDSQSCPRQGGSCWAPLYRQHSAGLLELFQKPTAVYSQFAAAIASRKAVGVLLISMRWVLPSAMRYASNLGLNSNFHAFARQAGLIGNNPQMRGQAANQGSRNMWLARLIPHSRSLRSYRVSGISQRADRRCSDFLGCIVRPDCRRQYHPKWTINQPV